MEVERVYPTIVEAAQCSAAHRPNERAYVYLADGETISGELTRLELDVRARAIAAAIAAQGAEGAPVLILCPAGLDYVASLFGCFYSRAVAVPAYPPTRTGLARTMPRIRAICEDCAPRAVLTTGAVRDLLKGDAQLEAVLAGIPLIAVDALDANELATELPSVQADDLALLQYTSGSTSAPKGVLVTHGQISANASIIYETSRVCSDDVLVSWLPPYHDMGLVGGILQATFACCPTYLMPPDVFLRRPARWLRTASRLRATGLLTPNFALDACVRRIDAEERASLDLSAVRIVYIGAEPIRSETLDRFSAAFAPAGFRREALFPCYGMAEATLMITGGTAGQPPIVRSYVSAELEQGQALAAGDELASAQRSVVGCGHAVASERLLIVDPDTRRALPEGRVGEVWVQSPGVARGYFQRPEETEQTFNAFTSDGNVGPMLRTGDLGFLDGGELFITGRLKDLIIIRGRNHAPQDIERTVQALDDALVLDAGAAFAIELDGAEQLAIVQEVDKRAGAQPEALLARIPAAILDAHDITPAVVLLIKRGSLGKTSSGKIQRRATRNAYLAGTLDIAASWRAPAAEAAAAPSTPPAGRDTVRDIAATKPSPRVTATPSRRALEIEQWLRDRIASKLGIAADEIDPRETLARYGVDSALAAELVDELERWLQLRLDTTISYDHPTIVSLSRALAAMSGSAFVTHRDAPTAPRLKPKPRQPIAPRALDDDPIAIVGMACRFPGAPSLAAFWELLCEGRDAITEVPRERWDSETLYAPAPGTPGKMCSKWGGFIDEIDRFDAGFFGISPHEAARMDPQQRLFLEVAWEALEDAGLPPSKLAGTRTGVFAGVCTSDFAMLYGGDLRLVDGDYGTGSAPSIVANRLSYLLDLKGPSETLDSACSSALAALHHACQGLAQHDCEVAIVGGVNAVLSPEVSVSFSQIGALARDGRCKAFDTRADGFVRSEGAGVVVLKRLSAAQRAGDRVYALVAGSALNHDGRSNGLSAPSGPAQRDVIERALQRARITPSELDYVEAHGVGTQVADAVELHALGGVLEGFERTRPLLVGSAKTNVGHLEAASGMVSVIKVALALSNEQIPRQLHCEHPVPSLAGGPVSVVSSTTAWQRSARPRYGGISGFGFGGSNAHVVLREAPVGLPRARASAPPDSLITLSAKTASALSSSVRRLVEHLDRHPELALEDVAFTLSAGRAALPERLAITASSMDDLRESLLSVALGATGRNVTRGSVKPSAQPRFALAFSEGPLDPGCAIELRAAFPRAAATLDQCERLLRDTLEVPLRALLWDGSSDERARLLEQPSLRHAALLCMHHALVEALQAFSLEPALVLGSGAAEYSAAAAAGCITWEQAIAHGVRRGAVLEGLAPGAAQRLTLRDAKQALTPLDKSARPARLALFSAQLDRVLAPEQRTDAAFWSQHLLAEAKAPTQAATDAVAHAGCDVVIELNGVASAQGMLRALGLLFTRGVELDLEPLAGQQPRQKVSLPTYPFERERHWLDFPVRIGASARPSSVAAADKLVERPSSHPFAGRMRSSRPAAASESSSGFIRRGDGDGDDKAGGTS